MGASASTRTGRASQDHRGVCKARRARRLFLGVAPGEHVQPSTRFQPGEGDVLSGAGGAGAAQHVRDVYRLCSAGRASCRLSESGRYLWHRGCGIGHDARRHPGARFWRSLLGLSGRRLPHRQLRTARQDVQHHAGFLSARRPELAG